MMFKIVVYSHQNLILKFIIEAINFVHLLRFSQASQQFLFAFVPILGSWSTRYPSRSWSWDASLLSYSIDRTEFDTIFLGYTILEQKYYLLQSSVSSCLMMGEILSSSKISKDDWLSTESSLDNTDSLLLLVSVGIFI